MMKVLLADDSPTTRFKLGKSLRDWGYDVEEACDGAEAWEVLSRAEPPRIAIIDWMMPEVDGVEICRKLNGREEGPFIYTILLSAKNESLDRIYALESGAHTFISKPIAPLELKSHLGVGQRLVESEDKLKDYADRMRELATIDNLTKVMNRGCFFEEGSRELSRAHRYHRPLSLLMMDADDFKAINDTHGHAVGDDALRVLAATCQKGIREQDLIARMGGEEFAALLIETDMPDALEVAERLRFSLSRASVPTRSGVLRVTVSVGVASLEAEDVDLETLLRRADRALYKAKANGKNRVEAAPRAD